LYSCVVVIQTENIQNSREGFYKDVITQVVKERKETGKRYNDVLQILMDACDEEKQSLNSEIAEDETDQYGSIMDGADKKALSSYKNKKLSEIEMLAQCILFFIVGYETTASTLTFMAYALAMNPEWQEKLIEEVDRAFEKHAEMSYDTVREMKVLDAVVSETLRMYPPALNLDRTACEDYELGNTGIVIEKGMMVCIPIYAMHYDPEFFEDPETFNPNRFMDPSETKHPPVRLHAIRCRTQELPRYAIRTAGDESVHGQHIATLPVSATSTNTGTSKI
ncbi:cytochrome P450 3A21, partial [Caerostris extrusa]